MNSPLPESRVTFFELLLLILSMVLCGLLLDAVTHFKLSSPENRSTALAFTRRCSQFKRCVKFQPRGTFVIRCGVSRLNGDPHVSVFGLRQRLRQEKIAVFINRFDRC